MLYVCIRHEDRPFLYLALALVPYAFVWYYFERVRSGELPTEAKGIDRQPKISVPLFLFAVIAWLVALWFQLGIQDPRFIPAFALFMLPVVIHAVGLLWMIYTAIRYEEHPLPFLFLSCIPFTFVWYYFARIRAGKARRLSLPIAIRPQKGAEVFLSKLLLIVLVVSGTAFALWYMLTPWIPENTAAFVLVMLFFFLHPFGALWMLYKSLLSEKKPLPYVILAFAPYAFVWYYFARIRHGKTQRFVEPATGRD